MIAKSMPLAMRDMVLIGLSVAVTVLAWWPREQPHQHVSIRRPTGNTDSFTIPLNDPRLGEIRQRLFNRVHPGPSTDWVLARWRRRLATHYIAHRPVSRQDQTRHVGSGAGYWQHQLAQAQRTIEYEQRRSARRRAAAAEPPIALGDVVAGPRRPGAWLTAWASGLLVAFGFAQWAARWPALAAFRGGERTRGGNAAPQGQLPLPASGGANAGEPPPVRVEIPLQWVRVRQPLPVALRRWAMAVVVVAALSSVWIR